MHASTERFCTPTYLLELLLAWEAQLLQEYLRRLLGTAQPAVTTPRLALLSN
jgi:hypothetical protein